MLAGVVVAHSLRVVLACDVQASPRASATSINVISSMLGCEVLVYLVIRLRHLLFLGWPSWRPPRLLVLGELRLHQLRLLRLLQAFHLYSERGKLGDRLSPILRIPVPDILLVQFLSKLPDVAAASDLVISFHMLHREEHVVLAAHVVEAEVHRRAVSGGRQNGLRHDAWDV